MLTLVQDVIIPVEAGSPSLLAILGFRLAEMTEESGNYRGMG